MLYRLAILNGPRKGEVITVPREPLSLGRAPECTLCLDDPEMALHHAVIEHGPGGLAVRDQDSMNKVLVNNHEVRESRLKHGDILEVGQTRFLVQAVVQAEVQNIGRDPHDHRAWLLGSAIAGLLAASVGAFYFLSFRGASEVPSGMAIDNPFGENLATSPVHQSTGDLPPNPPPPPEPAPEPEPAANESQPPVPQSPVRPPPPAPASPLTNAVAAIPPEPVPAKPVRLEPPPPPPPDGQAVLDAQIKDLMGEANRLIANNNLSQAETLLQTVQKLAPNYLPAYETDAAIQEKRGLLDPALAQWEQVFLKAGSHTAVTARAQAEVKRLSRAREHLLPAFSGKVRILSADQTKFPQAPDFEEMRMLNIRLSSAAEADLDASATRVEVRFFDRDPTTGKVNPTQAMVPRERLAVGSGSWRTGDEKTLSVSYVAPRRPNASTPRPEVYHGFTIRVFHHGALQDELARPKDLLPGSPPAPSSPGKSP